MKRLSLGELEDRWRDVERALDATPEIDRWCSGPDWVLSVHEGFGRGGEALLLGPADEPEDPPAYAMLCRYRLADGRSMIAGLEPLWGFASPLVGGAVARMVEQVAGYLARQPDWDVLVLPGMPTPIEASSFTTLVVGGLGCLGSVSVGEGITRQVADLNAGYGAWLDRRPARFRRNLRNAAKRAEAAGVTVIDVSEQESLFDRLLVIEGRSWKGAEASGILSPEMRDTYRAMVERLQAKGRLRVHVARLDGADVGYILGGVRAGRYRGLQLSYTDDAASLSIGHLLQHHQIRLLCATGEAEHYDLGMDLEYKRRWADRAEVTFTIVIDRGATGDTAAP